MSNLIQQKQVQGLVTDLATKALDSVVVKKSNNLSDINASSARTNLGVYSQSQVDALIAGAENAHSVATLTARNALSGLKISDRVFISDDGDGKWALYIVTAVTDGLGSSSTFVKIADEDIFNNALSASAVKASYESNANTNVYTDAEKTKVGHISITQAVDLDAVESELASTTSTANSALSTANSANTAAANAQSTANGAVSDAATAQSSANAAQTTANGAISDAASAQNTADSAITAAAAAQSTADRKADEFAHATQEFSGLTGPSNNPIALTLEHPLASGFTPQVFFNGLAVQSISYSPGVPEISIVVPYATEVSDVILVTYHWR